MKKHILCFGDSNTHGWCSDPSDSADHGARFNEDERWTQVLQTKLGHKDYLVIEEGRSGRTTVFEDPLYEGLCGLNYITPCLSSHQPIDLLIIMLGTNDTKDRFGCNAACIAQGMSRLIKKAKDTECWGGKKPNILVICPPVMSDGLLTGVLHGVMGETCPAKSRELAKEYKIICDLHGVHFLDAEELGCEFNKVDFMHLTRKGHATLANALADLVPTLLP